MDALLEFLNMGGYAFYVWWAYAIVTVMLALNLALPLRRNRAVRRRLRRLASDGRAANESTP
jgi:heme exporter protein CcmD